MNRDECGGVEVTGSVPVTCVREQCECEASVEWSGAECFQGLVSWMNILSDVYVYQ